MNNNQEQYQEFEIDLVELLTILWRKKLLILAMSVVFCIAGVAYALLAPQRWSAKAIVEAQLPSQLGQLQLRLDNFVALVGVDKSENTEDIATIHERAEIISYFSQEKLFVDFLQAFSSFENKKEFLKKIGYPREEDLEEGVAMQQSLAKKAKYITVKQRKDEDLVTLTFGGENAQEALEQLNEYLVFIQAKEVATKNKLLENKIANRINTLNLLYQAQKAETFRRLQNEIALTAFALRISKTAGIEAPVENLNNQSFFAIDLGSKALYEKLNILKEIKKPELINLEITSLRFQLDSLETMPQGKVSFVPYHFSQAPSEPFRRDKPRRFLVVVLSTFAGLLTGVVFALLRARSIFRNVKKY